MGKGEIVFLLGQTARGAGVQIFHEKYLLHKLPNLSSLCVGDEVFSLVTEGSGEQVL